MEPTPGEPTPAPDSQIDPVLAALALERLRSEQNLPAGVLAGLVAAALGAALWAAVTVATGAQVGWMAVGVGFAVGLAVRAAGKGIDRLFSVVAAVLALGGCVAGNLLAVCAFVARERGIPLTEVLARLEPQAVAELLATTFDPMDLLFYAIAVYEAFKLAPRPVTPADLARPL